MKQRFKCKRQDRPRSNSKVSKLRRNLQELIHNQLTSYRPDEEYKQSKERTAASSLVKNQLSLAAQTDLWSSTNKP